MRHVRPRAAVAAGCRLSRRTAAPTPPLVCCAPLSHAPAPRELDGQLGVFSLQPLHLALRFKQPRRDAAARAPVGLQQRALGGVLGARQLCRESGSAGMAGQGSHSGRVWRACTLACGVAACMRAWPACCAGRRRNHAAAAAFPPAWWRSSPLSAPLHKPALPCAVRAPTHWRSLSWSAFCCSLASLYSASMRWKVSASTCMAHMGGGEAASQLAGRRERSRELRRIMRMHARRRHARQAPRASQSPPRRTSWSPFQALGPAPSRS